MASYPGPKGAIRERSVYTVDPGKEVGDELHLRGSLDLNNFGKPVLVSGAAQSAAPAP